MKLRMMRRQMDFRKGILAKEWEHAQMKMKLRHMEGELHSYERLKVWLPRGHGRTRGDPATNHTDIINAKIFLSVSYYFTLKRLEEIK